MILRAVIVDDEIDARLVLKDKIAKHCKNVEVIFDSDDLTACADVINTQNPDIVFLDIQMPDMSGFEFLELIKGYTGEIVFITAYDQYALKAFDVFAFGYLLKPIGTKKLINLIEHIRKKYLQADFENRITERIHALLQSHESEIQKLAIPVANGYIFLAMDEIIRCEGAAKYTIIFYGTEKAVSTRNIGYFINILEKYNFFASHKSHLVNVAYVDQYTSDGEIVLKNGDRVPLSRRRKMTFLKKFN